MAKHSNKIINGPRTKRAQSPANESKDGSGIFSSVMSVPTPQRETSSVCRLRSHADLLEELRRTPSPITMGKAKRKVSSPAKPAFIHFAGTRGQTKLVFAPVPSSAKGN